MATLKRCDSSTRITLTYFVLISILKKEKENHIIMKMLWCAACLYWRNGIPAVHNVFFYIYALLHFCIWAILSVHCASEYMKTNMFIHKQRFFFNFLRFKGHLWLPGTEFWRSKSFFGGQTFWILIQSIELVNLVFCVYHDDPLRQ